MKLGWLTDIHLNFLGESKRKLFYDEIVSKNCDGILISGDIAEALCVIEILNEMASHIKKPIYFVLGNHDYYGGQVSEVRKKMTLMNSEHQYLFWLPSSGIQELSNHSILLGQDGWADGRLGDYQNSWVVLNDSHLILDLSLARYHGKLQLLHKMQELADSDAIQLEKDLNLAVDRNPKKVIVLTHVPPFEETCMYGGVITDPDWLPFYSSKATGDVLKRVAEKNPLIEFLVLCGHTHSKATYNALENLVVKTGAAEYSRPEIQEIIYL